MKKFLVILILCLAITNISSAALSAYSQDFETLDVNDPNALADDGWVIYGNVFNSSGVYLYGYGTFPAPNHNLAFSQIVTGEGGTEQGTQQLSVFSDYENADHGVGNLIESNVFHEMTVAAEDVNTLWTFSFDVKKGDISGDSTAIAFIKTLDPGAGYAMTNFLIRDTYLLPTTWGSNSISIYIDSTLVGQILQFGFSSTSTNYEPTGMFYDNINFAQDTYVEDCNNIVFNGDFEFGGTADDWIAVGNAFETSIADHTADYGQTTSNVDAAIYWSQSFLYQDIFVVPGGVYEFSGKAINASAAPLVGTWAVIKAEIGAEDADPLTEGWQSQWQQEIYIDETAPLDVWTLATGDNIIYNDINDVTGEPVGATRIRLTLELRYPFVYSESGHAYFDEITLTEIDRPADYNSDGVIDMVDFATLASKWQKTDAAYDLVNLDGVIDIDDLIFFLEQWLWEKCL